MATSQNGFTANDRSLIQTFTIPGTDRKIALRKGPPGELLCHFAAWFDKHVESVDGGQLDDWGYAERPIRGSSTTLSNHASGTAIDLNAPRHPLGASGTFTREQAAAIRRQLKKYEGCIRWGGDYRNRKDEMHFEIDAGPEACGRVLNKLRREVSMNTVQKFRTAVTKALLEYPIPANREAAKKMQDAIADLLEKGPKK